MNTNPQAKMVVCYGDSNTFGAHPFDDERYPANIRWVGVVQDLLGSEYEVINEGLCGRTFVAVDPAKPFRAGITALKSILETNKPIDILTIMLGTNDLKSTYQLSVEDITKHLQRTLAFIQKEASAHPPKIIVICPAPVVRPDNNELDERMVGAPEKSKQLPSLFKKAADDFGCAFINAGDFISLEATDGYHLAEEHHKLLGEKVAAVIKKLG